MMPAYELKFCYNVNRRIIFSLLAAYLVRETDRSLIPGR